MGDDGVWQGDGAGLEGPTFAQESALNPTFFCKGLEKTQKAHLFGYVRARVHCTLDGGLYAVSWCRWVVRRGGKKRQATYRLRPSFASPSAEQRFPTSIKYPNVLSCSELLNE